MSDGAKGLVIPEMATKPVRKNKGLRAGKLSIREKLIQQQDKKTKANGSEQGEGVPREQLGKKEICIQTLLEGNVQSFVDLFYLTHREESEQKPIPIIEVMHLRDNLITSEKARRLGETTKVFKAYVTLASYFEETKDYKTAIFFYEKCLEIARLTQDREAEMNALHYLGSSHYKINEYETSCKYHELHAEYAKSLGSSVEKQKSYTQLIRVYMETASKLEGKKQFEDAITYYTKCIEASEMLSDKVSIGKAKLRIGKAYISLNNPAESISFLTDYNTITIDLEDLAGEAASNAALAQAYVLLNNTDEALHHLIKCLDLSIKTENSRSEAKACEGLGIIYNNKGNFPKAIEMFEKNYELTKTLVQCKQADRRSLDVSKINLGVVRGNAKMGAYFKLINSDLTGLLSWKNKRTKF